MGKRKKRTPRSYKDVTTAYLAARRTSAARSLALVKEFVDGGEITKRTLHRAAKHLAEVYGETGLREIANRDYPIGQRGARAPVLGEARLYRMQRVGGRVFLRIPGGHLGVSKGKPVRVCLEDGPKIVILPARGAGAGDELYLMQQTGRRVFLRVPGGHLGVSKGKPVRALFEPGPRITITPELPAKRKKAA